MLHLDKKLFGENLKKIRQAKNVSRKQLAEILGMNENAYGGYERGDNIIPLDKLFKLADYLKTPIGDFLGGNVKNADNAVFEYRLRRATKIITLCGCSLDLENDGTIELTLSDELEKKIVIIGEKNNPQAILNLRADSLTFKDEKDFIKIVEFAEDQAAKKILPVKTVIKQIIDKANADFEKSYRDNLKKHEDKLKSKTEICKVHWSE